MLDPAIINLLEAKQPSRTLWVYPVTASAADTPELEDLFGTYPTLTSSGLNELGTPATFGLTTSISENVVGRIKRHLREDLSEYIGTEKSNPSWSALRAGLKLTKRMAPFIMWHSDVKCAAFTEENGDVAVVFESHRTDRRLTCRFSKDGSMGVYHIDENMESFVDKMRAGQEKVKELAEWITTKAFSSR